MRQTGVLGRGTWAAELLPDQQRPRAPGGEERAHRRLLKVARGHSWTPHGSLGPWPQAQRPAPPCPALSSALLSQTLWQPLLGESRTSSPQSRVLRSVFASDITSPRILSFSASSRVRRVPKGPTAPPRTLRCPSLHNRMVASTASKPPPLERTQRRSPRKHPKAPLHGTPPCLLKPPPPQGTGSLSGPEGPRHPSGSPTLRSPLPRNAPSPDHAVRALADVLQLRVARAHVERLPLHYFHLSRDPRADPISSPRLPAPAPLSRRRRHLHSSPPARPPASPRRPRPRPRPFPPAPPPAEPRASGPAPARPRAPPRPSRDLRPSAPGSPSAAALVHRPSSLGLLQAPGAVWTRSTASRRTQSSREDRPATFSKATLQVYAGPGTRTESPGPASSAAAPGLEMEPLGSVAFLSQASLRMWPAFQRQGH